MNLTNMLQPTNIFTNKVQTFSKYISQQDKYDLPPFETSFNSQTLLIESTPIPQNNSFCLSSAESKKQSFILKNDRENKHYCDINEEFSITINDYFKDKIRNKRTNQLALENLCDYLIKTVRDLEIRIENLTNAQKIKKKSTYFKDSQTYQTNKNMSFLNITKQTEKLTIQKCQGCSKYKDLMQIAVQNIQNQVKAAIYKQEMQKIQKQSNKIQLLNVQYKKEIQKLKGQNRKFKELIKQYQVYNKRKILKNSFKLQNNYVNEEGKNALNFKSNYARNKLQRENSLDQRLQENEYFRYAQMSDQQMNKFYSPEAFRRIENQIFVKQTPKTPQNLTFGKLREENQKTELKNKSRSCNGILRQIIQFEQKNEREIKNHSNKIRENKIKSNYPNNYLLQSQLENKDQIGKIMSLTNFQTMQSLQELIKKDQSKFNVTGVNKQYFPSNF